MAGLRRGATAGDVIAKRSKGVDHISTCNIDDATGSRSLSTAISISEETAMHGDFVLSPGAGGKVFFCQNITSIREENFFLDIY